MADNVQASADLAATAATHAARFGKAAVTPRVQTPQVPAAGTQSKIAPATVGAAHGIHAGRKASFVERSMDRMSSIFSFALLGQLVMMPVAFVAGRMTQIFSGAKGLEQVHHKLNAPFTAMNATTVGEWRDFGRNVRSAYWGNPTMQRVRNAESVFSAVRSYVPKESSFLKALGTADFWGKVRKGLPNTSIGHALMAGMLVTGSAALLLRTGRERGETNDVLNHAVATLHGVAPETVTKDMLGPKASGFVKNLAQQAKQERKGKVSEAAGHMAGNAIFGATLGMGGGMQGMMGVMAGQMMVEQLGAALNEKSTALQGYQALATEAAGQGTLSGPNRIKAVKLVIAASPDIAAKGGVHNRLSGLIAKEMVTKQMPLQQILQTANDPRAMGAFVAELSPEKVKEALAPKPKHGAAAAKAPAHSAAPVQTPAPKPAPMLADAKILGGGGAHAQRLQAAHIGHSAGLSS